MKRKKIKAPKGMLAVKVIDKYPDGREIHRIEFIPKAKN